ncbi:tetratricopeptide repeat protein [Nostoc sp.]
MGYFGWLIWRHRQRRIPEKSYQALKIKPDDDYEAWYNGGNALVNLGKLEEAIASYDQALKIKPGCTKLGTTGALRYLIWED